MPYKEYIHISEAVNVYNKTRQTFYNYIKKLTIQSKKVNNKIYLKVSDIEKILSDYIHISENTPTFAEIISPYEEKKEYLEKNHTINQKKIEKDLLLLHKQYYTLQDTLIEKMKDHKKDILFDAKAINYNQEQRIITTISQQYKDIFEYKKQLSKKIDKMLLKNKKTLFWAGYSSLILIQLLIATYIL